MNTLNEFCYRNAEAGEPESSFSKRKASITSVYNKYKNAKVPWNWYPPEITELVILFQMQMIGLQHLQVKMLWEKYK